MRFLYLVTLNSFQGLFLHMVNGVRIRMDAETIHANNELLFAERWWAKYKGCFEVRHL